MKNKTIRYEYLTFCTHDEIPEYQMDDFLQQRWHLYVIDADSSFSFIYKFRREYVRGRN